jgi:hypothetical protein
MKRFKEQSAHEGHCAVAQKLTPLHLSENGREARFETTDVPETIGPDLTVSVLSQSFTKARGR